MSIVEIAAWIIVLKTAWEWFDRDAGADRRRLIVYNAARAEYHDTVNAENEARTAPPEVEDEPEEGEHPIVAAAKRVQRRSEREKREREREKNLERQRQLLIRYPDVLIPPPASHYIKEAEEALKRSEPERQPFKAKWKWWVLAIVSLGIGLVINEVLKAGWSMLMDWFHR